MSTKPFLSIPNWDELQHYKDRSPPWIKLQNALLEDYNFEQLPDASKGHLLCIMLLASRVNNCINPDPKWIARKIGATSKIDIDGLLESGFLQLNQSLPIVEQSASELLAQRRERERAEEEERERKAEAENRFLDFWLTYDKNVNKPKCHAKFMTLNKEAINTIIDTLPGYIRSTPDKQYRKAPLVYLNGECWNDEIVLPTNNGIKIQHSQSSYKDFPA